MLSCSYRYMGFSPPCFSQPAYCSPSDAYQYQFPLRSMCRPVRVLSPNFRPHIFRMGAFSYHLSLASATMWCADNN